MYIIALYYNKSSNNMLYYILSLYNRSEMRLEQSCMLKDADGPEAGQVTAPTHTDVERARLCSHSYYDDYHRGGS